VDFDCQRKGIEHDFFDGKRAVQFFKRKLFGFRFDYARQNKETENTV